MADPDGIATGYSFEGQLLGHIIQGVKTIDRLTLELGFPREKAIIDVYKRQGVLYAGFYGHGGPNDHNVGIRCCHEGIRQYCL